MSKKDKPPPLSVWQYGIFISEKMPTLLFSFHSDDHWTVTLLTSFLLDNDVSKTHTAECLMHQTANGEQFRDLLTDGIITASNETTSHLQGPVSQKWFARAACMQIASDTSIPMPTWFKLTICRKSSTFFSHTHAWMASVASNYRSWSAKINTLLLEVVTWMLKMY